MSARYVIWRHRVDGLIDYLEDYSICGGICEFSSFSWDREDAQRFTDLDHADRVASYIARAKVSLA